MIKFFVFKNVAHWQMIVFAYILWSPWAWEEKNEVIYISCAQSHSWCHLTQNKTKNKTFLTWTNTEKCWEM